MKYSMIKLYFMAYFSGKFYTTTETTVNDDPCR